MNLDPLGFLTNLSLLYSFNFLHLSSFVRRSTVYVSLTASVSFSLDSAAFSNSFTLDSEAFSNSFSLDSADFSDESLSFPFWHKKPRAFEQITARIHLRVAPIITLEAPRELHGDVHRLTCWHLPTITTNKI